MKQLETRFDTKLYKEIIITYKFTFVFQKKMI